MLEVKVRKVGSSLGVLLPKKALDQAGIREGDTIRLPILPPTISRDFYGVWKERPVLLEGDE